MRTLSFRMTASKSNTYVTSLATARGRFQEDSNNRTTNGSEASPIRWRRWAGFFWDTLDGDLRERKYMHKLDTYLLYVYCAGANVSLAYRLTMLSSYICLGYFIKYLDQTNYSKSLSYSARLHIAAHHERQCFCERHAAGCKYDMEASLQSLTVAQIAAFLRVDRSLLMSVSAIVVRQ